VGQADLDVVRVDSTMARAHHQAAGMILDGELATALEQAAKREKGQIQLRWLIMILPLAFSPGYGTTALRDSSFFPTHGP
jgi:hypothetical protein